MSEPPLTSRASAPSQENDKVASTAGTSLFTTTFQSLQLGASKVQASIMKGLEQTRKSVNTTTKSSDTAHGTIGHQEGSGSQPSLSAQVVSGLNQSKRSLSDGFLSLKNMVMGENENASEPSSRNSIDAQPISTLLQGYDLPFFCPEFTLSPIYIRKEAPQESNSFNKRLVPRKIRLALEDDAFYILSGTKPESVLKITRDGKPSLCLDYEPQKSSKLHTIYGLVGILSLSKPFLVVILHQTCIGAVYGRRVNRIDKVAILPLQKEAADAVLLSIRKQPATEDELLFSAPSPQEPVAPIEKITTEAKPDEDDTTLQDTHSKTIDESELEKSMNQDSNSTTTTGTSTGTTSRKSMEGTQQKPFSSMFPPGDSSQRIKVIASKSTESLASTSSAILNVSVNAIKEATKNVKKVLPKRQDTLSPEEQERLLDEKVIRELQYLFETRTFYYSLEYDLTNSLQRKSEQTKTSSPSKLATSLEQIPVETVETRDNRFFWNEHLASTFIDQQLGDWIVPIMQGFIHVEPGQVDSLAFDFIMIARRSRDRAGLRYERRGVDEEGNAANFVENEMILIFKPLDEKTHHVSFVQTRGSIPLFWTQLPTQLKPLPTLDGSDGENEGALLAHFARQHQLYGQVIAVNLVEQAGKEAVVGMAYRKLMMKLDLPKIQEADFHEKCKNMNYDNLDVLLEMLESDIGKQVKYFWASDSEVICRQTGVIRTNCMDCLDRTNVVQAIFAKHVAKIAMIRLGCEGLAESGQFSVSFERIFKTVWANNGDNISQAYTGTRALKSDFTRTGKRNIQGIVNDAANSVSRMYKNNFVDGFRQAAIDVFLGVKSYESIKVIDRTEQIP